jgi:hypothetical protein
MDAVASPELQLMPAAMTSLPSPAATSLTTTSTLVHALSHASWLPYGQGKCHSGQLRQAFLPAQYAEHKGAPLRLGYSEVP